MKISNMLPPGRITGRPISPGGGRGTGGGANPSVRQRGGGDWPNSAKRPGVLG